MWCPCRSSCNCREDIVIYNMFRSRRYSDSRDASQWYLNLVLSVLPSKNEWLLMFIFSHGKIKTLSYSPVFFFLKGATISKEATATIRWSLRNTQEELTKLVPTALRVKREQPKSSERVKLNFGHLEPSQRLLRVYRSKFHNQRLLKPALKTMRMRFLWKKCRDFCKCIERF